MRQSTYYLGRVHKANLDESQFTNSLLFPESVSAKGNSWTFINTIAHPNKTSPEYIYAELAKYVPEGTVPTVDESEHKEQDVPVEKLIVARSPFVYIPKYSGIAYQHVWNRIGMTNFMRTFCQLVREKENNFFVDCSIDSITEYQQFFARISNMKKITRLNAKVQPPNPMYGKLWQRLKEYLKDRKAGELKIDERSQDGSGLNTNLLQVLQAQVEAGSSSKKDLPKLVLIEEAILMSADGYGRGRVEGTDGEKPVVIRTADVVKSFKFDTQPEPCELFKIADNTLREIANSRHMKHAD